MRKIVNRTIKLINILLLLFIVFALYVTIENDDHESSMPGGDTSRIISNLRNLKAGAVMFCQDNVDILDTIKPEIKLLVDYMDSPKRLLKNPGEFIFMKANGNWWVGRNLEMSGFFSKGREHLVKKLNSMAGGALYGSMDINKRYEGEDIIYMRVK